MESTKDELVKTMWHLYTKEYFSARRIRTYGPKAVGWWGKATARNAGIPYDPLLSYYLNHTMEVTKGGKVKVLQLECGKMLECCSSVKITAHCLFSPLSNTLTFTLYFFNALVTISLNNKA